MKEEVRKVLKRYISSQERPGLIAACSGGRDSICLLHILKQLQEEMDFELKAVYVHHGLRAAADEEARWLTELLKEWKVDCCVKRVDVMQRVRQTGESIEEAARFLRYQALQEEADGRWIVTAHHGEDQAETVLLRMLRGCGLKGLAGMEERRGNVLRPLLRVSHREIEKYIEENSLPYVEDESNQDESYTRNWIRHRLIPLLRERNPEISRTLADMAERLRADECYLEQEAEETFRRLYQAEGLDVEGLRSLPGALRIRVLRLFIEREGGLRDIGSVHIRMLEELIEKQSGAEAVLPGKRIFIRRYGCIARKKETLAPGKDTVLPIDGKWHDTPWGCFKAETEGYQEGKFAEIPDLRCTKWLNCDTITERLLVRSRRPGDYLTVQGGHKSLKKYMIEEKIIREERDRVALVAAGSHVLWIVGYRLSDECRVGPGCGRVLRIDYDPGSSVDKEEISCSSQKETM